MTPSDRKFEFWVTIIMGLIALCIMLFSCSTCRYLSVQDARHYQEKGYQTRICVYPVGTDGLIMGLGIWTHHAQAQVYVDGQWKWVSNGEISDSPEYSIDGEIYYWDVSIYEGYLRMQGRLE